MPWLKTVGCDCPECGPDPCTAGCYCDFNYSDAQSAAFSTTFDVTGQFITTHDVLFEYSVNPFSGSEWIFEITVGGVSVFSTGCLNGVGGSTTISVPAGTTEIGINIVDCGTEPGDWEAALSCIQNPP